LPGVTAVSFHTTVAGDDGSDRSVTNGLLALRKSFSRNTALGLRSRTTRLALPARTAASAAVMVA